MNQSIKRYVYILGTICVVVIVFNLFLKLLPWLLLFGVVLYIGIKVKGFINNKKDEVNNSAHQYKDNSIENNYGNLTEDYTTGEVIDVDYEDVDNKAQSKK